MSQPPKQKWPEDAPKWANYMATDKNGEIFFYQKEPEFKTNYWLSRSGKVENKKDVCPNWETTLIKRPIQIDWSKTSEVVRSYLKYDLNHISFPSPWIAWNYDNYTQDNPLPKGLVVEGRDLVFNYSWTLLSERINWANVRCFRIIGIHNND